MLAVIDSKIRWRSRRQDGQRRHRGDAEQRAGDERGDEDRRDAAAAALDDAGQPADVGAVDDRHESAHAGDQERDDAAGDGRGDQHPQPVPVGEQAHRHRAQQRQPGGERDDDGDDRGGRAQRRHHRGLRELDRLKRAGPSRGALRARSRSFLDSASRGVETHARHAVTGDTAATFDMHSKPM